MDLQRAVRELGAIELEHYPADLTVLDPNQLYLHHVHEGRVPDRDASDGDMTAAHKHVRSGSYVGWFQGRSATGSNVENVLSRLGYPVR